MARAAQLLDWFGTLTPASLDRIGEFYHPRARFKDPFNEVEGIGAIRRIFTHMFETTAGPRFVIGQTLAAGDTAFVLWDFEFALGGKPYRVQGATHLTFDAAGLVTLHRDYWDPAEELWQKLPVIGPPIRWLRRKFTASPRAGGWGSGRGAAGTNRADGLQNRPG